MRALRRTVRGFPPRAVGRPRPSRRALALRGFARHPDRQETDLFSGTAAVFLAGAAPDPVLRPTAFSVARQARSGDGRDPRRADRDPEGGLGVHALYRGQSAPAPDGEPGYAG